MLSKENRRIAELVADTLCIALSSDEYNGDSCGCISELYKLAQDIRDRLGEIKDPPFFGYTCEEDRRHLYICLLKELKDDPNF